MSLRHWLQLALTDGIGPILSQRLIAAAGGVEPACEAPLTLLRDIDGIGTAKASKIHESLAEALRQVDAEQARAETAGVTLICRDDAAYPTLLKAIPDPPGVLWMKGTLEPRDLNALAIVGSRQCSYYGREQAERFASLLAGAGMTVVSGGARGVDSAAHRGALAHPAGRTIAVLGSGVDRSTRRRMLRCSNRSGARGAVISEYPLGTPPVAENFPRRNRIVSGASRGVLVIEADARSGALITARQACDDHGRPVFALPGRVDNKMSAGPHLLIRDGATLASSLEDILDGLGPLPQDAVDELPHLDLDLDRPQGEQLASPQPAVGILDDAQQRILRELDGESLPADAIIERAGLPAHVVMQQLTILSLRGLIHRVDGQTYAKR